jgi:hypothetical protein
MSLERCSVSQDAVPSSCVVLFHKGNYDPFCLSKICKPVVPDALPFDRTNHPFGNGISLGIADVGEGKLKSESSRLIHERVTVPQKLYQPLC